MNRRRAPMSLNTYMEQRPEGGLGNLLLPGSLFMAIGPQLFAPFMFVDFAFPTFF